jgi:hypothetical protein
MQRALLHEARDPRTPRERLIELAKLSPLLARLVLQHETTDAEMIGALYHFNLSHLRPLLAEHPNTPPAMLRRLAFYAPGNIWKNPALPLILLESPEWLFSLDSTAVTLLFMHPNAPPEWLVWATERGSASLQNAVAKNPKLPAACLQALLQRAFSLPPRDNSLLVVLAARPDLIEEQQHALAAAGGRVSLALGTNPALCASLAHLRKEPLLWVNRALPSAFLASARFWDEHLPPFLREAQRVLQQPAVVFSRADASLLSRVRLLLLHPKAPAAHLEPLLSLYELLLRAGTKLQQPGKAYAPVSLLLRLAKRRDLPPLLVRRIVEGEDSLARSLVIRHGLLSAEERASLLSHSETTLRYALAQSRGLSAEELATLARAPEESIRSVIARRSDVPAELLSALACDVAPGVRLVAFRNPRTPTDCLALLRRAGLCDRLQKFAPLARTLSPEDRARLNRMGPLGEALAGEPLPRVVLSVRPWVGEVLDESPRAQESAPEKELSPAQAASLAESRRASYRKLAAGLRSLPRHVREALADDVHVKVRQRARLWLRISLREKKDHAS